MQELPQILKHEAEKREEIENERKQASLEIEQKRQALAAKLEEAGLTDEEKDKVFEYKKRRLEELEKETEQKLAAELKELARKSQANTEKAVNYVVEQLLSYS